MQAAIKHQHVLFTRIPRTIAFILIAVSLAVILTTLPVRSLGIALEQYAERLGPLAPLLFLGVVVVFTLFFIPTWPMPFLAGALFGSWRGAVLSSLSTVAATTVSCWLARILRRTAFRERLERSPRLRAFERTIEKSNWRLIAALRLSHFLPFGMQNYAIGLTRVSLSTVLFTTWIVTLPGTILQTHLGHLGFRGLDAWQSSSASPWQTWGIRLGAVAAMLGAVAYIGWLARSTYRAALGQELEALAESEDQQQHADYGNGLLLPGLLAAVLVVVAVATVLLRDTLRRSIEGWSAAGPPPRSLPWDESLVACERPPPGHGIALSSRRQIPISQGVFRAGPPFRRAPEHDASARAARTGDLPRPLARVAASLLALAEIPPLVQPSRVDRAPVAS